MFSKRKAISKTEATQAPAEILPQAGSNEPQVRPIPQVTLDRIEAIKKGVEQQVQSIHAQANAKIDDILFGLISGWSLGDNDKIEISPDGKSFIITPNAAAVADTELSEN